MSLPSLISVLLDFERSPGRFPLAKREPAPLFDQSRTVLLLAAGRAVEGLEAWDAAGQEKARRAARFFVRAALLRPGTDPYTVLGLPRSADADAIRSHYRLMIRLTHPDFSGGDSEWPADAATRINLANDVLSSASRRADLERTLAEAAAGVSSSRPGASGGNVPQHRVRTQGAGRPQAVRGPRETASKPESRPVEIPAKLKMAMLACGALAATGALLALNPSGRDSSLVTRESARPDTADPGPVSSTATPTLQLATVDDEPPSGSGVPADSLKLSREMGLSPPKQGAAAAQAAVPQIPALTALRPASAVERPTKVLTATPRSKATDTTAPIAAASAQPASPAPVLVAQPAPVVIAPDPAKVADPAPQATSTTPAVAPKAPRLPEVRPLLARIEQTAQRGLGVPLAMLIHPSTRKNPGTQKFVFDFQDALAGYRVTGLTRTDVDSREVGDQLDVDLRMHFDLEDLQGSSLSRQVGVRARFGKVEDSVALVRMTVISQAGGR